MNTKRIILFFLVLFLLGAGKAYAFNFHGRFISVKNVNAIKSDKNINISDFRALLKNWYNLAAGQNSFLLPKGHYLYHRTKHRRTLALLTYYILRHCPNVVSDINQAGKHNETALYIAQKRGQYKVISVLLLTDIKPAKANLTEVYNSQSTAIWSKEYLLHRYTSFMIRKKYKSEFNCHYKKFVSYAYSTNKFTGVKKKIISSQETKKICHKVN
jgi:hypothetical protein